MAYVTAYYALVTRARLRKGETVFVQSGWTPVGQVRLGTQSQNKKKSDSNMRVWFVSFFFNPEVPIYLFIQ